MKEPVYFINDRFYPCNKALINVKDLSTLRGYGVFDFLRTYNNKPFCLKEHLGRLFNSARLIDLKIPWKREKIEDWIFQTLSRNNFNESQVRIIITGGETKDTISPLDKPTIIILVDPLKAYPDEIYKNGVFLKTFPLKRFNPRAKSISYIPAVIAHKKALKEKAFDGIFLDENNNLLEATTSNLFFFFDKKLVTPKDDILFGITRNIVLKLAKNNFQTEERQVNLKELKKVTECFMTASSKEIIPVVKIDNVVIGNGKPGKNTQKIISLFEDFTSKY